MPNPLGDLVEPSEPFTIRWHWALSLLPFYRWLALALLFLLKPNRSRQAAGLLLAVGASMGFIAAVNYAVSQFIPNMLDPFAYFIFAIAVMMLVAYRYSERKPGRGGPEAVLILSMPALLVISTWPFGSDIDLAGDIVCMIISAVVFLTWLTVARRVCRRKATTARLLLSLMSASFGVTLILGTVASILAAVALGLGEILIGLAVTLGLAVGAGLLYALLLLPFVLLLKWNPLYRARFRFALRMPALAPETTAPEPLPLEEAAQDVTEN